MDLIHATGLERIFLRKRRCGSGEFRSGGRDEDEDEQADGDEELRWRSCRVGRAAQNDRASSTGSICGSEAEEQQIRPEREMQQEEERSHRLEATSWRTPLATVQVDSLRFKQLPHPSRSAYDVLRTIGLGDPLELQPDFKSLSVSFSPVRLTEDNRFASSLSGSNLGKYQRSKLIPLVPLPFFVNELLGLYLIDIRIT
jgi:hypothetical protein